MKSTINQLTTIAGMLRGFLNTEPEAPRLFREYLEMVPVKELRALESEHEEAIASLNSDLDDEKANCQKAEADLEKSQAAHNADLDKYGVQATAAEREIEELRFKLTAMSERSDNSFPGSTGAASPGDHAMIEALQGSLFIERARVKQLEAALLLATKPAAAPVKPLDPAAKPPAGKARPETPAGKAASAGHSEAKPATAPPVLTRNPERNGIELRFNGKPDDATRAALTAAKWKWSARQPGQPWYVRYTEEQYLFAQSLATGSAYTPMPEEPSAEPATPEPEAPAPQAMPDSSRHSEATPDATPTRRRTIIIPNF